MSHITPARNVLLGVDHEIDRRQIIQAIRKGVAFAFRDCLGALQVADDVHTTVGLAGMFAASPVLTAGVSRGYGEGGRIADYLTIVARYNESGELSRVEGECKSGRILFLSANVSNVATTLPVSAVAKLHRPSALPLVLTELETARALGVDDMTQARLDVQAKTGSAKPPGGALHALTSATKNTQNSRSLGRKHGHRVPVGCSTAS